METRSISLLKAAKAVCLAAILSSSQLLANDTIIAEYQSTTQDEQIGMHVIDRAVADMVQTGRDVENQISRSLKIVLPEWLDVDTKLNLNSVNVNLSYKF